MSNEQYDISVILSSPPEYVVKAETFDTDGGKQYLNQMAELIQQNITDKKGNFLMAKPPHIPKKRDRNIQFNGFYLQI
jgi:translation initiation factor 2 alpha subunit (eIF-2alpha)